MSPRDLDRAQAVYTALVTLLIQEHGGTSNPAALSRVDALCAVGEEAIDDVGGRVAIRGVRSLATLLYSNQSLDDIEIGSLRGVPAIRLQIANELGAFRGRIEMLEARKPSRPEIPAIEPKSLRVLVVEDNRDSAESLKRLLALCGYEVTIAETAMEGFEAATREQPHVVLCDIGLPDSDGYCLAEALQKHPVTSAARLIAVTAYSKDEDKERSRKAGFLLHLVKPVSPGTILKVLEDSKPTGGSGTTNETADVC
jgi:CheY-like chemotaxis protein